MGWAPLITFLASIAFAPVAQTHASGIDACGPVFAELLGTTKNFDTERMDSLLRQKIALAMGQMSKTQRKTVAASLRKIEFASLAGNATGALTLKDLQIQLDRSLRDHPYSRIVLAHEFDHLTRASARFYPGSSRFHHMKMTKSEGVLKEETRAFSAEYDFIRASYSIGDLPRLRAEYPTHMNDTNADFIRDVFDAVASTKDEYISLRLAGYFREQSKPDHLRQVMYLAAAVELFLILQAAEEAPPEPTKLSR